MCSQYGPSLLSILGGPGSHLKNIPEDDPQKSNEGKMKRRLGFRVQGSGFRVQGSGFRVGLGFGLGVWGLVM